MRSRNVKPGLLQNEILGSADPLLSLLFEGLWMLADREGRLEDKPLRICSLVFPYRRQLNEKRVNGMLQWLHDQGFIVRYKAPSGSQNGGATPAYIQVLEFSKHQRPHNKEKPSIIPSLSSIQHQPSLNLGSPPGHTQVENGSNLGRVEHALIPDSGFLIPDSLSHGPSDPVQGTAPDPVELVFAHWQTVHKHPKSKLDPKRRKLILARLKDGYTVEQLCTAIGGFKNSPHHMGDNDRHTVFDDIELFLRDAKHIDMGTRFASQLEQLPTSEKPVWR